MAYDSTDSAVNYDYLFKLVLVGDSGVGKSSLMLRFADDSFDEIAKTTVGVDFKIKTIYNEGKAVKLQIWDTAGQERFRAFSSGFFRGAHGIILVYSTTDKASFDSIPSWMDTIHRNADVNANILLVGNKSDMTEERVVGEASGRVFADEFGLSFLETSAKNATNVHQAFITMATQIQSRIINTLPAVDNMADSFRLESRPAVDQTYCCSYF